MPKSKLKARRFVSFLVFVSLLVSSPSVLAAVAGKCCMKKQMRCHSAGKMGHSKNRVCHLANHVSTGDKYAQAKGESAHSNDPITCCEKHCHPQLTKAANGKQSAHNKAGVDFAIAFGLAPLTEELFQAKKIFSYRIKNERAPPHSQPLYSLHSAYLI